MLSCLVAEDIALCLEYNIKMKQNMYSVCHNYLLLYCFNFLNQVFNQLTSLVVQWSEFPTTDHEVSSLIPGSNMGTFP
jgi:hypothetical protein